MVAERGHARDLGEQPTEPSAEKAVGSRQAAWRPTTSVEQKEKSKDDKQQATYAKEHAVKLEAELQKVCDGILALINESLILSASTGELTTDTLQSRPPRCEEQGRRGRLR